MKKRIIFGVFLLLFVLIILLNQFNAINLSIASKIKNLVNLAKNTKIKYKNTISAKRSKRITIILNKRFKQFPLILKLKGLTKNNGLACLLTKDELKRIGLANLSINNPKKLKAIIKKEKIPNFRVRSLVPNTKTIFWNGLNRKKLYYLVIAHKNLYTIKPQHPLWYGQFFKDNLLISPSIRYPCTISKGFKISTRKPVVIVVYFTNYSEIDLCFDGLNKLESINIVLRRVLEHSKDHHVNFCKIIKTYNNPNPNEILKIRNLYPGKYKIAFLGLSFFPYVMADISEINVDLIEGETRFVNVNQWRGNYWFTLLFNSKKRKDCRLILTTYNLDKKPSNVFNFITSVHERIRFKGIRERYASMNLFINNKVAIEIKMDLALKTIYYINPGF